MGDRVVRVALAAGLAIGVLGGCGDDGIEEQQAACAERSGDLVEERPTELSYRSGDVVRDGELTDARRGFVLQVVNHQPFLERLELAIDGRTAVDVDLPASDWCWGGHGPVFTFGWELPAGPVEAVLTIQGSPSSSRFAIPDEGTVFGVVSIQSERSWGDMEVSTEPSVWG
jgi:hypothetical protein